MKTVTIIFNNKEVEIPEADAEFFVNEKGAKLKSDIIESVKSVFKGKNSNKKKK